MGIAERADFARMQRLLADLTDKVMALEMANRALRDRVIDGELKLLALHERVEALENAFLDPPGSGRARDHTPDRPTPKGNKAA